MNPGKSQYFFHIFFGGAMFPQENDISKYAFPRKIILLNIEKSFLDIPENLNIFSTYFFTHLIPTGKRYFQVGGLVRRALSRIWDYCEDFPARIGYLQCLTRACLTVLGAR